MKKRILFVVNDFRFSNGVAMALRNIILNLNQEKYDINLLVIYEFDRKFAAPIMDRVTVVPGFDLDFRGFDKLVNLIPQSLLYKFFIKEKYDLEISFQFGIPTKCIASGNNSNRICWMHTFDSKMKLRKYYKKYNKLITVSKVGCEKLVAESFDRSICDYCYNIIDQNYIIHKSEENIDLEVMRRPIVVTVARMAPDKAYMRYVRCIESVVSQQNLNAEFWLIGGGKDYKHVKEYVKSNSLESYIKVLGKQDNPYKFLKYADVYFCCSRHEGFSTSCQEAALLGIPVVSVNVDGANELIETANCGLVVDNSETGIKYFLNTILTDEKLIEKWKLQANLEKAKFYKDERIKKIESIIDSSLL